MNVPDPDDPPLWIYAAPLVGFRCEEPTFWLTETLGVRPLEDYEREVWGEQWLASAFMASHALFLHQWAEPDGKVEETPLGSSESRGLRVLDIAVAMLRLYKRGSFAAPVVYSESTTGGPSVFWSRNEVMRSLRNEEMQPYELTQHEVGEFRSFMGEHAPGSSLAGLGYATTRFSSACSIRDPEDALIDLMIAAEALFLDDSAAELKYRAALRIACFLAHDADEREAVFKAVKTAYDVRSWIVHGKTSGLPSALKRKSLSSMVIEFEDLMRWSLRRALVLAQQDSWPPNWDRLLLSGGQ